MKDLLETVVTFHLTDGTSNAWPFAPNRNIESNDARYAKFLEHLLDHAVFLADSGMLSSVDVETRHTKSAPWDSAAIKEFIGAHVPTPRTS